MSDERRPPSHPRRDPWLSHGGRVPTGSIPPGARPATTSRQPAEAISDNPPGETRDEADPDLGDLVDAGYGYYDHAAVAALLRVDGGELDRRADLNLVLALRCGDGSIVYPRWQFDDRGHMVPFLCDLLRALADGIADPWTWALWLTSADDDGPTAIDALRAGGDPRPLLQAATEDAARWRQ